MISVDDRIGSIELIPTLQHLAPILIKPSSGVPIPPITSTRLLSADVCFDGKGRDGKKTMVGIERKRVKDMLNSIRSGRYSGRQLPEMLDYYDHSYLIVEGMIRCGPGGELETLLTHADPQAPNLGGKWVTVFLGTQPIRFFEIDHFIATMETHTPVKIRRTLTDFETAAQIISLYTHHYKAHEDHHSHQALHTPQNVATIGKAGLVRRVGACLDGIGWEKSASVAVKFRTVYDMVMAGPEEWKTIPGIGKVLAQRAFDQLRGKYKNEKEEL